MIASHGRGWLVLCGLGYLAFVVYGSLVPLNFRPLPMSAAIDAFLALADMEPGVRSRTDWATNVLLTIPLAFLWTGVWWPGRNAAWRIPVVIAVFAACLVVSITVEFLQLFFPGRTASLSDILAQAMGAAIGITAWWLAGPRLVRWITSLPQVRGRGDVAQRLLLIYLLLMVGYNILPLDLTLSPVEVYHKWREGRVLIVPFGWTFTDPAQQIYELITDVVIWVPAAFLWRLSSTRSNTWVWTRVVAMAVLIEFLQLFVYSRVSDSTDVVLAAVGGALGIGLAGWVKRRDRMRRSHPVGGRAGASNPLWPWLAATLAWLAVLAVVFWYPFDFNFDHGFLRERVLGLKRAPLEAYYFGSEIRAVTEVLHKTGFMFPLGILLGGIAARLAARLPRGFVHGALMLFIAAVATSIEAVQLALPGKTVDPADWILEVAGGIAGYVALLLVRSRLGGP